MKLERYMSLHSLTDAALAARLGVAQTTVMRWRKNETRPDWDAVARLQLITEGLVTANDFVPEPVTSEAGK